MNKLRSNIFTKRPWGSEIVWSLTDSYVAKTVEINKNSQSRLIVHENRDKSIIVLKGPLYLLYGPMKEAKISDAYKLTEGWSWFIEPGYIYSYIARENPVMLVEVSSPELDDGHIIVNEDYLEIVEDDFIEPPME